MDPEVLRAPDLIPNQILRMTEVEVDQTRDAFDDLDFFFCFSFDVVQDVKIKLNVFIQKIFDM